MNFIFPPASRAFGVVALALACGGCDASSNVSAVVLATQGEVASVQRNGGTIRPGEFLRPPEMIRTNGDGAVVIAALPGVTIRLERDSALSLDELALRKRGEQIESRFVRVRLEKGHAILWVDAFQRGGLDFRLVSPAGELVIGGPVLAEIALEADGTARIVCANGALTAARVPVAGGQWIQLAPGTVRPAPRGAADTNAVWSILLTLRNLEPQFIDLQERQRERTPKTFTESGPSALKN